MTDFTIPPAALEAGARSLCPDGEPSLFCREQFRDACLAMLNAWEGAKTIRDDGRRQTYAIPALVLPLPPQEASDGKTLVDTISDEAWRHDSSGDNCNATDPQEASDDQ